MKLNAQDRILHGDLQKVTEEKRSPLAHGTESQVTHGKCLSWYISQVCLVYGCAASDFNAPGAYPPCSCCCTPTHKGPVPMPNMLYPRESASRESSHQWGRGLQTRANTAVDTRQQGCEIQIFKRKLPIPKDFYHA